MKASELIQDLRTLIQENGDHPVINDEGDEIMIVFSDDEEDNGGPAFVVE